MLGSATTPLMKQGIKLSSRKYVSPSQYLMNNQAQRASSCYSCSQQSYLNKDEMMAKLAQKLLLALSGLLLSHTAIATVSQTSDHIAPELGDVRTQQQQITAQKWMVATANSYASEAGAEILQQGGNAIDAMVTIQLVLGLVEPQSSGIGGGAFLLYWDQEQQELTSFDGRETAPFAATPQLFLDDKGQPLTFFDAVVGGRSVATPGTVKLLWQTHQQLGKLPWKSVVQPAIKLAQQGFIVSPRLANAIAQSQESLNKFAPTRAYFFHPDGTARQSGELLTNPDYAATLKQIAEHGAKAFYQGAIAKDIVATVRQAPTNPGVLSVLDLAAYQIKQRQPICAPYHQYQICGMGPPSSGALTVGQIMAMLSHYPMAELGPNNISSWRLLADASRLAFADRGRYMADSDYVPMPKQGLLAPQYIEKRAQLLKGEKALAQVEPGLPSWPQALKQADDQAIELPSTTHFVIVDKQKNVVSMTSTIENGFGSRLMVRGFLLNNQLTDFSFRSQVDGVPIANRVEPGKRPRSSMAPTIVLKQGQPYLAIGSPGGSQIIGYISKTLLGYLSWNLSLQQAIDLPNMNNRFGPYELEQNTGAEQWAEPLKKLGYQVQVKDLNSGVQAIALKPQSDGSIQLIGAADPRREGKVIGQ